ncbi:hypothetical protein EDB84DRAFT_1446124 [Lactarius hengduanensis]|nr:hypothetical protein EDB84DRAFT_1446124 [Lactarius hengduanensis]
MPGHKIFVTDASDTGSGAILAFGTHLVRNGSTSCIVLSISEESSEEDNGLLILGFARQGVFDNEIARRAYFYVARNQALSAQVRYRAQLQLNTFGRYTRPTTVKNGCTVTGRGRGVIGEFGLCRVRGVPVSDEDTRGELPGIQKASW